jgi:hypothetical protein
MVCAIEVCDGSVGEVDLMSSCGGVVTSFVTLNLFKKHIFFLKGIQIKLEKEKSDTIKMVEIKYTFFCYPGLLILRSFFKHRNILKTFLHCSGCCLKKHIPTCGSNFFF